MTTLPMGGCITNGVITCNEGHLIGLYFEPKISEMGKEMAEYGKITNGRLHD